MWQKVKVVLTALPTWGAAAVAVLTAFATHAVPVLPVAWQVKVAAVVASAVGGILVVVSVVSRVTPILFPDDKGLLPYVPEDGPDDWDAFIRAVDR